MWVDTGADMTCARAGFTVLAYTDRYVTLRGYSDSSDEEERVPVVRAATAIDLEDGTTIILIMNEVLCGWVIPNTRLYSISTRFGMPAIRLTIYHFSSPKGAQSTGSRRRTSFIYRSR